MRALRSCGKGCGFKTMVDPAHPSGKSDGNQGGIAIMGRSQFGMGAPSGCDTSLHEGRASLVVFNALVRGGFDMYGIYFVTSIGLAGDNLALLAKLAMA
eukprot:12405321-Karenia_brevis.AAC.1